MQRYVIVYSDGYVGFPRSWEGTLRAVRGAYFPGAVHIPLRVERF